jgi:hypothetical protein
MKFTGDFEGLMRACGLTNETLWSMFYDRILGRTDRGGWPTRDGAASQEEC